MPINIVSVYDRVHKTKFVVLYKRRKNALIRYEQPKQSEIESCGVFVWPQWRTVITGAVDKICSQTPILPFRYPSPPTPFKGLFGLGLSPLATIVRTLSF